MLIRTFQSLTRFLLLIVLLSPTIFSQQVRFMVLGDWGTGGKGQKDVAKAMAMKKQKSGADFILTVGDNFYGKGVESVDDPQWQSKFQKIYDPKLLDIPFYPTFGNHDYGLNPLAQIAYTEKNPRWNMPAKYYTFTQSLSLDPQDGKNAVTFFALDTQEMITADETTRAAQLHWLDSALTATASAWKIVYGHHPIYSNGSHGDSPLLKKILRPILEKHRVDVYFAGHDHDLQMLLPVRGVQYIISGGGAATRPVKKKANTVFAASSTGFLWCKLTMEKLEMEFVNGKGEALYIAEKRK